MAIKIECKRCGWKRNYEGNNYRTTCGCCGTSIYFKKLSLEELKKKAKKLNIQNGFKNENE